MDVKERLPENRNGHYIVLYEARHGKSVEDYAEFQNGELVCACWRCKDKKRPAVTHWAERVTITEPTTANKESGE